MIILKPSQEIQSLNFIGRTTDGTIISLRNDQTNEVETIDVAGEVVIFANYSQINRVWSLLEGNTYELIVYNANVIGDVLTAPINYRGVIYCTAQDITVNTSLNYTEGKILEHKADNKYKIYE